MLKGFRDFIMRGNVVDLAVAVVIGAAFTEVVAALVKDIITPIIAAIGGQPDFAGLKFTIHNSVFRYGLFLNAVMSFLIVAAAIYLIVIAPLNKLAEVRARRLASGEHVDEPEAKAEDVQLLEQIRDLLEAQQGRSGGPTVTKPSPAPN